MKIDSSARSLGILNLVRSKQERGSSQQEQAPHDDSNPKDRNHQELNPQDQKFSEVLERVEKQFETPPTLQTVKLGEAVEIFRSEVTKNANGLDVVMEGAGPGLKVILKDTQGGVVRSFTGEEFLKLRNAAYLGGRQSGKILDRKL